MSYFRTPEHRLRQAERIRTWRPWERSTGPRTDEGKAVSSGNAWKGGCRALLRELARALNEQREPLERANPKKRSNCGPSRKRCVSLGIRGF